MGAAVMVTATALDAAPGLTELSADGAPEDRALALFVVSQLLRHAGFDVVHLDAGMRRERLELILTPERKAWIEMLRQGAAMMAGEAQQ